MLRGAVHRLHLQLLCASADVQTLRAEVRSAEEAGAAESASAQRLQHSSVRVAESRRQQDTHARAFEASLLSAEPRRVLRGSSRRSRLAGPT